MNTNIAYLQYFVTLARTGSYTSAARELYVTQPSLTYGIKVLEQEVGCQLVETSRKGVTLTHFGRSYLAYAQSALASLGKGQETLDALMRGMSHISIAAVGPMSVIQVPELIDHFAKTPEGKDVDFNLQFTTATQGVARVADGRADIGFAGEESISEYKSLKYLPLAYDRLYLIVPTAHELARRSKVSLADIAAYPYIGWSEETGLHDILRDRFEAEGLPQPKPRIKIDDSFQAAGLVGAGFGIAVCPETPYMSYLRLKKINLDNEIWTRSFGLVHRKEGYPSNSVRAFVSFVEHHAKDPIFVYSHPSWDDGTH